MYPTCDPQFNAVSCKPCNFGWLHISIDPTSTALVTRGGPLDDISLCKSYFSCFNGFYTTINPTTGSITCAQCIKTELYTGAWWFISSGLTFGDPYSCLSRTITFGTPGAAGGLGFYAERISDNIQPIEVSCPMGTTALPSMAKTAGDCVACPMRSAGVIFTFGTQCPIQCSDGLIKRAERCIDPASPGPACVPASGYSIQAGTCVPSALPWNPDGAQPAENVLAAGPVPWSTTASDSVVSFAADAGLAALRGRIYVGVNADAPDGPKTVTCIAGTVLAAADVYQDLAMYSQVCTDTENYRYVAAHAIPGSKDALVILERDAGFNNRNLMWRVNFNLTSASPLAILTRWRLPGKPCSVACSNTTAFVAFCETYFLAFYDLSATNPQIKYTSATGQSFLTSMGRFTGYLIGGNVTGNADGMRDYALFQNVLWLARLADGSLFVFDQVNCRIAEIAVHYPGSPYTRATTLQQGCFMSQSGLPNPRSAAPYLNGLGVLFFTDNGLHQLDGLLRTIQLIIPAEVLAGAVSNATMAWSTRGGAAVLVANATHWARFQQQDAPCPLGQVAPRGANLPCTPCPSGTTANGGRCVSCDDASGPLTCTPGYTPSRCTSDAPPTCIPCTNAPSNGETFRYTAQCEFVYTPPCPANYYAAGTQCQACPRFAFSPLGSTSLQACVCIGGGSLASSQASECTIPAPDPWPDPVPTWALELACPASGDVARYVAFAWPTRCEPCANHPQAMSPDGIACRRCPWFKTPTPQRDACVCRAPAAYDSSGACACPAGHSFNAGTGTCEACPAWAAQPDIIPLMTTTGAVSCARCPAQHQANSNRTACEPCPTGTYRSDPAQDTACVACTENVPPSAQCPKCQTAACTPGFLAEPCAWSDSRQTCTPCNPGRLRPGQTWVSSADNQRCLRECADGFYWPPGELDCRQCTAKDQACPPGLTRGTCGRYADALCTEPCTNATAPRATLLGSVWNWARGCEWECAQGYILRYRDLPQERIYECAPADEAQWDGWSSP